MDPVSIERQGSDLVSVNHLKENHIQKILRSFSSGIIFIFHRFWASGDPDPTSWFSATCCTEGGRWRESYYFPNRKWICERKRSSFNCWQGRVCSVGMKLCLGVKGESRWSRWSRWRWTGPSPLIGVSVEFVWLLFRIFHRPDRNSSSDEEQQV